MIKTITSSASLLRPATIAAVEQCASNLPFSLGDAVAIPANGAQGKFSTAKKRGGRVVGTTADGRVRVQMGPHSIVTVDASRLRAVATTSSSDEQQDEARMNDFFAAIDAEQDSQLATLEMELLHLKNFSIDDEENIAAEEVLRQQATRQAVVTASLAPSKNLSIFSILPADILAHRVLFDYLFADAGSAVSLLSTCKLGHFLRHDALWERALVHWSAASRHVTEGSPSVQIETADDAAREDEQSEGSSHIGSVQQSQRDAQSAATVVAASLLRANRGDAMAALFRDALMLAVVGLLPQAPAHGSEDVTDFDVKIGGSFAIREFMFRSAAANPSMASRADFHLGDMDVFVITKDGKLSSQYAKKHALFLRAVIEDIVVKCHQKLGVQGHLKLAGINPSSEGAEAKLVNLFEIEEGYPDDAGRCNREVISLQVPGLGKIDFVACFEHSRCIDLVKSFDLSVCQICAAHVASTDAESSSRMPALQFEMTQRAERDIATGTMTSTGAGRFSYKRIKKYINRGFRYRSCTDDEQLAADIRSKLHGGACLNDLPWLYYCPRRTFPSGAVRNGGSGTLLDLLDNCVAATPTLCLLPNKRGLNRRGLVAVPLNCYDPSFFSSEHSTSVSQLQRQVIRWISTCIVSRDHILALAIIKAPPTGSREEEDFLRIRQVKFGETRQLYGKPTSANDMLIAAPLPPLVLERLHEILADPEAFQEEVHRVLEEEPLPSKILRNACEGIPQMGIPTSYEHGVQESFDSALQCSGNECKQLSHVLQALGLGQPELCNLEFRLRDLGINFLGDLQKLEVMLRSSAYLPHREKLEELAVWARSREVQLRRAPLFSSQAQSIDSMFIFCERETAGVLRGGVAEAFD
jgi:hypothetical protein